MPVSFRYSINSSFHDLIFTNNIREIWLCFKDLNIGTYCMRSSSNASRSSMGEMGVLLSRFHYKLFKRMGQQSACKRFHRSTNTNFPYGSTNDSV